MIGNTWLCHIVLVKLAGSGSIWHVVQYLMNNILPSSLTGKGLFAVDELRQIMVVKTKSPVKINVLKFI
jgi:hypothetical protein